MLLNAVDVVGRMREEQESIGRKSRQTDQLITVHGQSNEINTHTEETYLHQSLHNLSFNISARISFIE